MIVIYSLLSRKRIEVVITGLTRNQVAEQSARGFESLRFRQRQEMPLGEKHKKARFASLFSIPLLWAFLSALQCGGTVRNSDARFARYSNASLLTNPSNCFHKTFHLWTRPKNLKFSKPRLVCNPRYLSVFYMYSDLYDIICRIL